jgi:hypothetical protein
VEDLEDRRQKSQRHDKTPLLEPAVPCRNPRRVPCRWHFVSRARFRIASALCVMRFGAGLAGQVRNDLAGACLPGVPLTNSKNLFRFSHHFRFVPGKKSNQVCQF